MPRDSDNPATVSRLVPCPPRLKAILEALDKLPPGIELANLSYLERESPEAIREDIVSYLKDLPGEFVRQLWLRIPPFPGFRPEQARRLLVDAGLAFLADSSDQKVLETHHLAHVSYFTFWRKMLVECEFLRRSALVLAELGKAARVAKDRGDSVHTVSLLPVVVEVNSKGVADVGRFRLGEAIDGVDLSRLRECEICGKLFWAGRIDKVFCSPSCGNKLRKRRSPAYELNRKLKGH